MAASRLARGAPALALALFVAAALFHPACADEEAAYITACRQRCMVARGQETFRRGDQQACASQEHALPKPAVHTQCRQAYAMGRDRAAEKLCVLMCEYPQLGCDHSLSNEPSLKAELDAACAGPRRRRPTPGMGIACDTGFRGSLIRLCEVARKAEEPYLKVRTLCAPAGPARCRPSLPVEQRREGAVP